MGGFIAKQPNGLYCRFSTVVDTVTDWNMTEEDYINMRVEKAAEEARKEAKKALEKYLEPFDKVKDYFFPANNTIEEFNEMLKEMGDNEGLGDERISNLEEILKER